MGSPVASLRLFLKSFLSGITDALNVSAVRVLLADKEARNALGEGLKLNVFLLVYPAPAPHSQCLASC